MREKVLKNMRSCSNLFLAIAGIFLLLSTFLALINSIMRFSNIGGIAWAEEVSTLLVIVLVYFSQPYLEYNDDQLCISILQNALKKDIYKRLFHIIRGIATLAITGVLIYYTILVTGKAYERNLATQVLQIPRYLLYGCMLISFIITAVSWIITIFFAKGKSQKSDLNSVESIVVTEEKGAQ